MFEKAKPISSAELSRAAGFDSHGGGLLVDSGDVANAGAPAGAGETLRMLDWNELTARLNAARDLRLLLKRDASSAGSEGFALAAARYFRTRDVNPVALGGSKCSSGMIPETKALHDEEAGNRGRSALGDAREDG